MRKQVRWNLLKKKWNAKMINKFRELEQIHINFLEKERLKGFESPQKGSLQTQKVHCEKLVLEASNKTERSCIFKTNDLCMIVGASQNDEKILYFVKKKEQNLKYFQIKTEIARSQK